MSVNIIDSVKGLLGSDLITKASGMLGENSAGIQQALNGIVPSIFTGVLSKAASGDGKGILAMAMDAMKHGIPENLGSLLSGGGIMNKGMEILTGLFGSKTEAVSNAIAGYAGISTKTAATLMNVAAPAALGVLGKQAVDSNLNAGGLLSFLNTQKDHILNAVPAGLNLGSILGIGSLASLGSKLSGMVPNLGGASTAAVEGVKKTGSRWVLPLILLLAAIALIWFFMNKHSPQEATVAARTDTVSTVTDSVMAPVMATIKVTLPNGVVLDAYKGGIEDQLVTFLNDSTAKAGKDVWFDFDKLNFKTASADITDSSQAQVKNIAAILKAYPKAKIKIGGYTDKTGDSLTNKKLSQSRAVSVSAALKAAGSSPAQITGAEGYGSAFAKTPADGPEAEKMKDRHISVSVREK